MAHERTHSIGDDCPGGHYATPGSDGSCCQASQDTLGDRHAWNCEPRWLSMSQEELDRMSTEMGFG